LGVAHAAFPGLSRVCAGVLSSWLLVVLFPSQESPRVAKRPKKRPEEERRLWWWRRSRAPTSFVVASRFLRGLVVLRVLRGPLFYALAPPAVMWFALSRSSFMGWVQLEGSDQVLSHVVWASLALEDSYRGPAVSVTGLGVRWWGRGHLGTMPRSPGNSSMRPAREPQRIGRRWP
jgi:hypothetical protein